MDLSNEVHDQTVKDRQFPPVQDNTRPLSLIRPRSACLKPREEHQPPRKGLVRFRGIHKIRDTSNSSTKNLKDFCWEEQSPRRPDLGAFAQTNLMVQRFLQLSVFCRGFLITYRTLREGGRFP